MEVRDVIKRLNELGLRVEHGGNHYKVFDPSNGNYITAFSASPSDQRWHYNLASNLRKHGYELKERKEKEVSKAVDVLRNDLREFLRDNEMPQKQFASIAYLRAAPENNMRNWKNESAATQSVGRFLRGEGVNGWVLDLIEATMEHLQQPEPQSIDVDKEPDLETLAALERGDKFLDEAPKVIDLTLRERYANVLLSTLERGVDDPDALVQILDRLDRLVL